jgi:hypothetical protein
VASRRKSEEKTQVDRPLLADADCELDHLPLLNKLPVAKSKFGK